MSKLEIGTLIYDLDDEEWGLISGYGADEDEEEGYTECFKTIWSKSKDQNLFLSDLEQDRFIIYNV